MSDDLKLVNFHGPGLEPHLDALGALRIAVFREYPYLYDGSLAYEREYLGTYVRSAGSLVVLVFHESAVVGATTCLPLADEGPEFQEAFVKAGQDVREICYFGESILLPPYRGRRLGQEFFRRREAHARSLPGTRRAVFCAVDRPADHALRPAGYRSPETLWARQGYVRHPELQAHFVWKEIGEERESPKTLTFWLKELDQP